MHGSRTPASPSYYDPASLKALDEPVQRYLNHALGPGRSSPAAGGSA